MVLAQDAAQGSQAGNIVAEQKYQSDLKTYNENLAKEKAAADAKAQADAKAAVDAKAQAAAEAKAKADALAASKNYYATTAPPTQWIYKRGGTRYENPAFTNYEANRPERIAERAAMTSEERAKNDFFNQYVNQNPYATGKQINIAVHHFESTVQRGMSEKDWNAFRKAEDANRALALRQSAGLKAFGNAQISQAQQTELARLGGTATSGPTKVSGTLNTQRVPTAPGQAAIAQPWEAGFQKPVPVPPSTPASRFAEIATPGVGMFSGVQQKPSVAKPLAKGQNAKNRISPYLIPVAERSLIGRYSPEGKPVQGAPQVAQRYSVTDSNGKVRTFKDLETAKKYTARTSQAVITPIGLTDFVNQQNKYQVGEKMFATEAQAQEYIDTPRLSNTGQAQYDLSQFLDKASQYKTGNPIVDTAYSAIIGYPLGSIRSVVEGVNVLDNIGKYTIPALTGTKPSDGTPIPIQRTGDEVLMPVEISETGIRTKSLGEIGRDSIEYSKKYSVGDLQGGALSTFVPIGMGIKTGITIVGKFAAKKLAPKLIRVATSEIGSTNTIRKTPAIIQQRKPIISKESLYSNIQTTQQRISSSPKLLKPYTQPKNPSLGTGVIPKESIKGTIKTSPGFIPNKPSRPYTPLDTKKPVDLDPGYTPARRANEIDYTDSVAFGFKKTKVPLGVGVTKPRPIQFKAKLVKEDANYSPGIMSGFKESKVRLGVGQSKAPKPKIQTTFADKQFRGFQQRATVIGKIKFSKDFLPSKVTPTKPASPKKLDFANPWRVKPRKFDEPKVGKGDKLTGKDGSIQIVKSKSEVVKLKKPEPSPVKLISRKETINESVQKAGSARPIVILTKPAGRLIKKRKPIEPRSNNNTQVYAPESYQRASIPQRSGEVLSIRSVAAQSTRITPRLATKQTPSLAIKLTPVLSTKQPQIIKQVQPQKFKQPAPEKARPKLRSVAKFQFKTQQKTVLRESPNPRPKTRLVAGAIIPLNEKLDKKKSSKSKQFDFLGNTKLDSIEGLFRRSILFMGISELVNKSKKISVPNSKRGV
jgi:hypothetical protein